MEVQYFKWEVCLVETFKELMKRTQQKSFSCF